MDRSTLERIGNALTIQGALEANAAGSAFRLSRWRRLRPEERDYYGDQVMADEYRHSALCLDLGRYLGSTVTAPPGIVNGEANDLERLVALVTAERLFLLDPGRGFQRIRSLAPPIVVQALDLLEREERPHVAHGLAVIRRLSEDGSRHSIYRYRHSTLLRSRKFMAPVLGG